MKKTEDKSVEGYVIPGQIYEQSARSFVRAVAAGGNGRTSGLREERFSRE